MPAAGHRSRYASSTTRARRVGQEGLGLPAQGQVAAGSDLGDLRAESTGKQFFFLSTHFEPTNDKKGSKKYYNVRRNRRMPSSR